MHLVFLRFEVIKESNDPVKIVRAIPNRIAVSFWELIPSNVQRDFVLLAKREEKFFVRARARHRERMQRPFVDRHVRIRYDFRFVDREKISETVTGWASTHRVIETKKLRGHRGKRKTADVTRVLVAKAQLFTVGRNNGRTSTRDVRVELKRDRVGLTD